MRKTYISYVGLQIQTQGHYLKPEVSCNYLKIIATSMSGLIQMKFVLYE